MWCLVHVRTCRCMYQAAWLCVAVKRTSTSVVGRSSTSRSSCLPSGWRIVTGPSISLVSRRVSVTREHGKYVKISVCDILVHVFFLSEYLQSLVILVLIAFMRALCLDCTCSHVHHLFVSGYHLMVHTPDVTPEAFEFVTKSVTVSLHLLWCHYFSPDI